MCLGAHSSHYISVFHGRKRETFNLGKPVVDFTVVCVSPFAKDIQEPSLVIVLLCDDMAAIDLTSLTFTKYPVPYGKKTMFISYAFFLHLRLFLSSIFYWRTIRGRSHIT